MDGPEFDALKAMVGATSPPFSIAVIGGTGVGKSRLINAFFGLDVATVGTGRPVTQSITGYTLPGSNVVVYDTRGLEVEKSAETIQQLENLIVAARDTKPVDEQIHVAWLCVSAASRRFEPVYESIAQMLMAVKVPFVIVITKSFGPEALELKSHIDAIGWIKAPVVTLVAAPKSAGGEIIVEAFGLEKLAALTAELVGPARAASANYSRYSEDRMGKAQTALKYILDKKSFIQHVGNYLAMSSYGPAIMFVAPHLVANKMTEDILESANKLSVFISPDVGDYIRNVISAILKNSVKERGRIEIEKAKDNINNILEGDLSLAKSYFSKLSKLTVRSLNPKNAIQDISNLAKGDGIFGYEDPAWRDVRFTTMVMLVPVVEAHLCGHKILAKAETFSRSLKPVIRWSGPGTVLPSHLLDVIRREIEI